ncbi:MAG TPA: ABC transporter ATP-binding protein [Solirubrobacteraceae bacterium]|nr:ABC transporter ATP-binding protein [Solirubrobacteraceae bacterium]
MTEDPTGPPILPVQHQLQKAAFELDSGDAPAEPQRRPTLLDTPFVIDVSGVSKSFRIPDRRSAGARGRLPWRRHFRELRALSDVSFAVHRGEFFGIVGRNGSGKSTLLKILASVYRADAGRVAVAGRLAPFIELGVGLNPELTARENVVLNGVMMGLTRREAAGRLDAVLEFAELQEFVDLKLKNYSSGMLVRLAFATMIQADADVMLVDEVLAVGDASFAEKCLEVLRERRRRGKTLVLVTHDMVTVQEFCDRAMLLHDGRQRFLGDPDQAVLRYYRLNFGGADPGGAGGEQESAVSLLDVWLEDADGRRVENALHGQPFRLGVIVQAREHLRAPAFAFQVLNVDDVPVFSFGTALTDPDDEPIALPPGRRVKVMAEIENRLVPGRYAVLCSISRSRARGDDAMGEARVTDFLVKGHERLPGMITVAPEVQAYVSQGSV